MTSRASVSPKYAVGQRVLTRWGKEIIIKSIDIDVAIGYVADDDIFDEDELLPVADEKTGDIVAERCPVCGSPR